MMKFRFGLWTLALGAVLSLGGCSGSGSDSAGTGSGAGTSDATVVTNPPTTALPWTSIVGKTSVPAFILGADSAYTVVQRPVTIQSSYVQSGIDTFAIIAPQADVYGPGFSGSPIVVNGQIVGAVISGDDPHHLFGISITQEMTTGQQPSIKMPTNSSNTTSNSVWAGKEWYFEGPSNMMPLVTKLKGLTQANYAGAIGSAKPTTAVTGPGPTTPIPGSRYAAAILSGPEANLFVTGTYTFKLASGNWVATGHPIELQGPVQWPIYPAYTDFIEDDGSVETHMAGSAFGTLAYDGLYGSLIDLTKAPTTMPLNVTMQLNGTTLPTVTHYAIMDRGSQYEFNADDIGLTTPVQDATYALPDLITAQGSVTIFTGSISTVTPFLFNTPEESPAAFLADYEANVDEALLEVYANNPAAQITSVGVNLQMVTTPVGNQARH